MVICLPSFLYVSLLFLSFTWVIFLANVLRIVLNTADSGHLSLVPDFREKAFSFSLFNSLVIGLS